MASSSDRSSPLIMPPRTAAPAQCEACGHQELALRRHIPQTLLGALIVLISVMLAVPTLGVSVIALLWGLSLMRPRQVCTSCGHVKPERKR